MNLNEIIVKLKDVPNVSIINEGMTFIQFCMKGKSDHFYAHDGDKVYYNMINRALYINNETIFVR